MKIAIRWMSGDIYWKILNVPAASLIYEFFFPTLPLFNFLDFFGINWNKSE